MPQQPNVGGGDNYTGYSSSSVPSQMDALARIIVNQYEAGGVTPSATDLGAINNWVSDIAAGRDSLQRILAYIASVYPPLSLGDDPVVGTPASIVTSNSTVATTGFAGGGLLVLLLVLWLIFK